MVEEGWLVTLVVSLFLLIYPTPSVWGETETEHSSPLAPLMCNPINLPPVQTDNPWFILTTTTESPGTPDESTGRNLSCAHLGHQRVNISRGELRDGPLEPQYGEMTYFLRAQPFRLTQFCIESVDGEVLNVRHCLLPQEENNEESGGGPLPTHSSTTATPSEEDWVRPVNPLSSTERTSLPEVKGHFLRKCCPSHEKLVVRPDALPKYSCTPRKPGTNWQPALFASTQGNNYTLHSHFNSTDEGILFGPSLPNCSAIHELDNHKDIWFKMLLDGSVWVGLKFWFRPVWLPLEPPRPDGSGGYCVDELELVAQGPQDIQGENTDEFRIDPAKAHELEHLNQVALYCHIQRFDEYLFHRKLFGSLCVVASVVILILLIIYMSIWDRQNLSGWTQFNIFTAVFFVFGMEGVRTLVDYNGLLVQATPSCHIVAAIAQYFFFGVNTTWSVMCFDLFWTFWKLEGNLKGTAEHSKRLCLYLVFSWVVPLVTVALGFTFSHSWNNREGRMEGVYAFAHRRCSSPIRELGFQSQGIMFIVNVAFFIFTAALIWKHRRGIKANRRNSKSEKHTWRSVTLFVKLLIVMGVTSLSIPLDFFFGSKDPLSGWAVFLRAVHLIPTIAILLIFGFNEKNLRLIKQKYPRFSEMTGMSLCSLRGSTTETNPSRSGNQPQNNSSNV